jgi:predicted nucleotidyltransferase
MANSKQREIASAHIREIARTIKEKFNPRRVILFGSYGYGVPTAQGRGSDIDLFVIMNTSLPVKKQAFLIRREITSSMPLDVIVRTPEQVEERLKLGDFFIKKIMEKGVDL